MRRKYFSCTAPVIAAGGESGLREYSSGSVLAIAVRGRLLDQLSLIPRSDDLDLILE